ncbi:peritrophin-44 [Drosophila takahashii]|uniref:peritrophin-44 n=1 Tax=Drosophila takahashii TaxID=29030 RepID=UPI001CF7FC34|nr:peritrophin-44 [Drosophila takahashii]
MGAFNARIGVLAACLLMAAQASGYTMEQMCAQWSGEGYVGNPSNCRAWGYCKGQMLVSWGTCPDDYIYNSQTGICADASTTICSTSATKTCESAASPMYVANPMNCTEYCYCDGKGGLEYGACQEGLYSASSISCIYANSCPQDTICRFMQSNIYVGDPDNCGSYIACLNGYGTSAKCADNLFYNAATGMCQKASVTCNGDDSNSGNAGQFTVGYTNSSGCPADYFKASEEITVDGEVQDYKYVSDWTTCYGFYYCANAGATGVWNQCPTGTHFDPTKGECVSPAAYACPHNRCGNINNPFMAVSDTTCNTYTVCSTGATGNCPTTAQFYDEIHNICTTKNPGYAVCEAAA